MLVLSRKSGEAIQIGDQITLTIVSIKGKRVRIGIEAPADCRIVRDEVLQDSSSRIAEFAEFAEVEELELTAC